MAAITLPLDTDFGYATFQIGEHTSKKVDLQAAHDHYFGLVAKVQAGTQTEDGLWGEWKSFLVQHGFPDGLSIAACIKVVEAVIDAVKGLQKKDPPPGSSGGPG